MTSITFDGGPLDGQTHKLLLGEGAKDVTVRVELEFEHGEARVAREVTYQLSFGGNTANWPMDAPAWATPAEQQALTAAPRIA